jgi:hypothetical protein
MVAGRDQLFTHAIAVTGLPTFRMVGNPEAIRSNSHYFWIARLHQRHPATIG